MRHEARNDDRLGHERYCRSVQGRSEREGMMMRTRMQIALLSLLASLTPVAAGYDLDQHRWSERLLVLVTPQADDPVLQEQLHVISRRNDAMLDRELELVQLHLDTGRVRERTLSSEEVGQLRSRLGLSDEDRLLILIGKDGGSEAPCDSGQRPARAVCAGRQHADAARRNERQASRRSRGDTALKP